MFLSALAFLQVQVCLNADLIHVFLLKWTIGVMRNLLPHSAKQVSPLLAEVLLGTRAAEYGVVLLKMSAGVTKTEYNRSGQHLKLLPPKWTRGLSYTLPLTYVTTKVCIR